MSLVRVHTLQVLIHPARQHVARTRAARTQAPTLYTPAYAHA